jgi:CheY-like chemotaxis protein
MAVDADQPGNFFYVLEDPLRILFVDDDPIMREFALVHLSTDKAEVVVGADGIDAIKAVEEGEFDVVVMDLDMPNMDGFEALSRIRADERTQGLPVIVVTEREEASAIDRAFEAGATSLMAKPINWRLLSHQVCAAHRTHKAELEFLREGARAREEAQRAAEGLKRLAREGAGLLCQAMLGPPELKRMARDYVALLEKAADAMADEDELRMKG